jgi:uncharacterized protein YciI
MTDSSYFVYRLIPPRPRFDVDMSDDERVIMGRHAAYWQELTDQGRVLIFGPVRDSTGAWGLAVFRAANDTKARGLVAGDPAVSTGMATCDVGPMLAAVLPG